MLPDAVISTNKGPYRHSEVEQTRDLESFVHRLNKVSNRLSDVEGEMTSLVGRLYGEGVLTGDKKTAPRSAGVCGELAEAIERVEDIADRAQSAVHRLQQLA